jgi:hypothetical protein
LYHTAILYPTRKDLAVVLKRLIEAKYPLTGASDHGVSEAIYLDDPDQNGVELYWDRPKNNGQEMQKEISKWFGAVGYRRPASISRLIPGKIIGRKSNAMFFSFEKIP